MDSDGRSHVVVSWRGEVLWEARPNGSDRLDVEVPGPGWIAIASVMLPAAAEAPGEGGGVWLSEVALEPSR